MLFRYFLLCICFFNFSGSFAIDLENDTIRLEPVTINALYYQKYSSGSQIIKLDSQNISSLKSENLDDLIRSKVPVYFKSYGNGMLSSITFRGTSANHTSVLWNGVNVNQPTLGQTDFSLFPVLAFDDVQLHFGAASSRFGSETIGGSISLDSDPVLHTQISGSVNQYIGSFGSIHSSANVKYRVSKKVNMASKIYFKKSDNDFEFANITKAGKPIEKQENSAIKQYGFLQDIFIKTSGNTDLSVYSWYNFSDRQIQPTMNNQDATDQQEDASLRLMTDFNHYASIGTFQYKMGYLADRMIYNKASNINTRQAIGQFSYEKSLKGIDFRLGTKLNHIIAEVDSYEDKVSENRFDLFGSLLYSRISRTHLSLNFRQTFVSGYKAPFSPSLGLDYNICSTKKIELKAGLQGSVNYRVPTLNERYWVPGGRMDINPEKSHNIEGNLNLNAGINKSYSLGLSIYHYNVDDWILWVPGPSYWTPENMRNVHSNGLDISAGITQIIGKVELNIQGNYSFTKSILKSSHNENDIGIGNQLPYTPVHMGMINISVNYKLWYSMLGMDYTGKRYVTSDNESFLPAYELLKWRVGRNIKINAQVLSVNFRINNLLNSSYQNVMFRAMPGRNYQLGVNFLFNN